MPSLDHRDRGYAFLVLMMMVTALLISITAALPSVYTAGQREKEEELIFRGNQYARAIMLFHSKFGRYPNSVDEIVKKTNGFRFLRHAYPDPMSAKGKWRLIHASASGMPIDSRNMPMAPRPTNLNSQNPNNQNSQNPDNQNSQNPADNPTEGIGNGGSSIFQNQMHGAFIIGVASSSTKPSIRNCNDHNRYDAWEFMALAIGLTGCGPPPSIFPGQGQIPGQPGQGGGPGVGTGFGPGSGTNPEVPPLTDQPVPQPQQ